MPGVGRPEPEADVRKTGDIPRGRTPRRFSRAKTGYCPLSAQVTERPGNPGAGRKPETSHSSRTTGEKLGRLPDGAKLMNCSTNQNPSQADSVAGARFLYLRENVGTLNPEFALAGATTRGPVTRHATTTVFSCLGFRNV